MDPCLNSLYTNDPDAFMMTIPEAKKLLDGAMYYGPLEGPDTTLYEKQDKWYRVTLPCLACLGITEYDDITPVVEIMEVKPEDLL
ncbi:MAG: hypothetical protein U9N81_07890 [Bacillota bacterium]|nr:hypothetical protein [Bacillota bacterium]